MSPLLKYFLALTVLLLSSHLVSSKGGKECAFDSKDFNATIFYLDGKSTRFRYPNATGQLSLGLRLSDKNKKDLGFRVACSAGAIGAGPKPTNLTSSFVDCVGGPTVKLAGTFFFSLFRQLGCSVKPEPTVRLTDRKAGDGKKIVEIGYTLGESEFLPVIQDLAVNSWASGVVPRWAHFKALPIKSAIPTSRATLNPSPLTPKVDFAAVYDVTKQRNSFMSLFNDTALVDKYLPADGTHSFVASQLVSQEDLYYEIERSAASFYETTVPIWKSVESGNWKGVGEAVRQIAAESSADDIDVWSGTYLSLWLPNAQNRATYVNLPRGLKPSQFLFKYVHSGSTNKGIVFVTVNNPHLTEADKKNVICKEISACKKLYPEFGNFSQGYTYCCSLKSFASQAERLGLPVFADSTELFVSDADEQDELVVSDDEQTELSASDDAQAELSASSDEQTELSASNDEQAELVASDEQLDEQ